MNVPICNNLPSMISCLACDVLMSACRFEDVFPGTPYDVVVDTMGGDYELRR